MILKLDNRSLCTERNKIGDSLPWDATKALRAEQTRLGKHGRKETKDTGKHKTGGNREGGLFTKYKGSNVQVSVNCIRIGPA